MSRTASNEIPGQDRNGTIEALAYGILLVNRLGDAWCIRKDLKPRTLGLKVSDGLAALH